jgi:anti-anti-sigma factor
MTDMALRLDVRSLGELTTMLVVQGLLDAVAAPALKRRIHELVDDGRVELVCDLTELGDVDSSGLSALVSGLEVVREHGGFLKLAGANEQVTRRLRSSGLDHVFELYPSVEAATGEPE